MSWSFEELQETIVLSGCGEWDRVDDRGFLYRELLVLRTDRDVSIGRGGHLDPSAPLVVERQAFAQEWVTRWGWKPPQWWYAEVRYRDEVIGRHPMMTVDAGNVVLPAGDLMTVDGNAATAFGLIAYEFDYQLARLLHGIDLGDSTGTWNEFDRYYKKASIVRAALP